MQRRSAGPSCHLHSTETPEFCEDEDEEDTGGSASVSMTAAVSELDEGEEEEDEEEAATVPGGERASVRLNRVSARGKVQNTIPLPPVSEWRGSSAPPTRTAPENNRQQRGDVGVKPPTHFLVLSFSCVSVACQ